MRAISTRPRSTRHPGARAPKKAMQLGQRARAGLGVAPRARRQRTKRQRSRQELLLHPPATAARQRSSSRRRSSSTALAAPRARRAFEPPRQLPQLQPKQLAMLLGHRAWLQRSRSAAAARGRSCGAPSPPGRPSGHCRRAGLEGSAAKVARLPARAPVQRSAMSRMDVIK